jgi:hypothetical protein
LVDRVVVGGDAECLVEGGAVGWVGVIENCGDAAEFSDECLDVFDAEGWGGWWSV